MLDSLEATLYISELLKETYKNYKIPIEVYTDNKSLHEALKLSRYVTDKPLRIDIGALKEIIYKTKKSKALHELKAINKSQTHKVWCTFVIIDRGVTKRSFLENI